MIPRFVRIQIQQTLKNKLVSGVFSPDSHEFADFRHVLVRDFYNILAANHVLRQFVSEANGGVVDLVLAREHHISTRVLHIHLQIQILEVLLLLTQGYWSLVEGVQD